MKKFCLLLLLTVSHMLFADAIYVSDRYSFTDPDALSFSTIKREKPYNFQTVDHDRWVEATQGKNIAVLIHGYNNEFGDAMNYCSRIMEKAAHLYDTFICYFWPGGNHRVEYLSARYRVVNYLPSRLVSLIKDLSQHGRNVDILAHSMGCRLALEALTEPSNIAVRNVFLFAPAVDDEELEYNEEYGTAPSKCSKMFVFYSDDDRVLRFGFPLVDYDTALGRFGSEDPEDLPHNVYQINADGHRHSSYASSDFVFNTISRILAR